MAKDKTGVDFVAGDTGASLELTFKDQDSAVVNLTGGTVAIYWRIRSAADSIAGPRQTAAMTLDGDPTTGKCSYTWAATDLDAPETVITEAGIYEVEVEAVFTDVANSSVTLTSLDSLTYTVRARFAA